MTVKFSNNFPQMTIKYISIFHSKALQNLPKIGIFGLKTNHLATLPCRTSPVQHFKVRIVQTKDSFWSSVISALNHETIILEM
jgi:hypothetical protein